MTDRNNHLTPTAEKWWKQAEADLKAARSSLVSGSFEWACFQSQQAGEKALKSFLYQKGYTSIITHSLKELVRECDRLEKSYSDLMLSARTLDMHYIPSRYPNGLAGDLPPAEFYEKEDAEKCIASAESILARVRKSLKS